MTIIKAQKEIKKITNNLKRKYKPKKIILFGSFAYGKPTTASDIDMLIIKNTKEKKINRIKKVLSLIDSDLPFEPIIYTPKEISERIFLRDLFIRNILKKGRILYEKK